MYCPSCGSEERQLSQYCRACGTDLLAVRTTLERPDAITESAVSARDQIGRAGVDKIRMTESASELQRVAEHVLPEIEKFLESPVERRLRRLRAGTIVAFIGLGVRKLQPFSQLPWVPTQQRTSSTRASELPFLLPNTRLIN